MYYNKFTILMIMFITNLLGYCYLSILTFIHITYIILHILKAFQTLI